MEEQNVVVVRTNNDNIKNNGVRRLEIYLDEGYEIIDKTIMPFNYIYRGNKRETTVVEYVLKLNK